MRYGLISALACPKCGHRDLTTVCRFCMADKLPAGVAQTAEQRLSTPTTGVRFPSLPPRETKHPRGGIFNV